MHVTIKREKSIRNTQGHGILEIILLYFTLSTDRVPQFRMFMCGARSILNDQLRRVAFLGELMIVVVLILFEKHEILNNNKWKSIEFMNT